MSTCYACLPPDPALRCRHSKSGEHFCTMQSHHVHVGRPHRCDCGISWSSTGAAVETGR